MINLKLNTVNSTKLIIMYFHDTVNSTQLSFNQNSYFISNYYNNLLSLFTINNYKNSIPVITNANNNNK